MPTLLARLTDGDKETINQSLNYLSTIEPLSAKELWLKLIEMKEEEKIKNPLFKAIRIFLDLVEKAEPQTYLIVSKDNKEHLTIGIGLDLAEAGGSGEALFHAAMPKYDWSVIYPNLRCGTKEYPKPNAKDHADFEKGLSKDQIDWLLYYTLIGTESVDYLSKARYVGILEHLNTRLSSAGEEDLSDVKFLPHQLIALVSMVYQNPKLLGAGLHARLIDLLNTKYDGAVLMEIMEASNKEFNNGIQNRREKEAAFLHGNPEEVSLTYAQYYQIKKQIPDVILENGLPSVYVLSDYEISYKGSEGLPAIVRGPTSFPPNSAVYFGSNQNQEYQIRGNTNNRLFAGEGNNEITVTTEKNSQAKGTFTYLAGNGGVNNYYLDKAGHVLIYDDPALGKIYYNYYPGQGVYTYEITGVAVASEGNETFSLYALPGHSKAEITKYFKTNKSQLKITIDEDNDHDVTLLNFVNNKFNIKLVKNKAPVKFSNYSSYSVKPTRLASGLYVGITNTYNADKIMEVKAHVFDSAGNFLRQFTIASYQKVYVSKAVLGLLKNGNFVVAYLYYVRTRTEKGVEIYTMSVEAMLCSVTGKIQGSELRYDYNAPQYDFVMPNLHVAVNDNNYIITYAYQWVKVVNDNPTVSLYLNGNQIISQIDSQYLFSTTPLNNGNFAILTGVNPKDAGNQMFAVYISNLSGQIIKTLTYQSSLANGAVSALGKEGFMLTTSSKTCVETVIFDGVKWSEISRVEKEGSSLGDPVNVPYLDDITFVSTGSGKMYIIDKNNKLLRTNGGNIPIDYSAKDKEGIIICETAYQRDEYPINSLEKDWVVVNSSNDDKKQSSWSYTLFKGAMNMVAQPLQYFAGYTPKVAVLDNNEVEETKHMSQIVRQSQRSIKSPYIQENGADEVVEAIPDNGCSN